MTISNDDDLKSLQEIGRIVAETLAAMGKALEPGMTTAELDRDRPRPAGGGGRALGARTGLRLPRRDLHQRQRGDRPRHSRRPADRGGRPRQHRRLRREGWLFRRHRRLLRRAAGGAPSSGCAGTGAACGPGSGRSVPENPRRDRPGDRRFAGEERLYAGAQSREPRRRALAPRGADRARHLAGRLRAPRHGRRAWSSPSSPSSRWAPNWPRTATIPGRSMPSRAPHRAVRAHAGRHRRNGAMVLTLAA
jgi:hypothetical protein